MLSIHDTIITNKMMKTKHLLGISLLSIALVSVLVMANFNQPSASAKNIRAASILLQTTATPPAEDASEIGSTDGILLMGMVIAVIVIVPVLFYKKK